MEGRFQHSSLLQLAKSRWIMAVMALYILFCSGATYIFAIFSGAIKESLHYNQETIDTLSFFKDLGANVGLISGLINEVLPSWTVLAMGAVLNFFGYFMIWLAVTHRIARPPTWQMYLYLCIGANSQTFANTGALVTVVKNFPTGRGDVLGILKGCVGLSGAIFTQIYYAIYGDDTRGIILLIGWLPSVVALTLMFFIRPITPAYDKRETRTFYHFLYLALLLAGFLTVAIIVENQLNIPSFAYKAFGAVTILLVISNLIIGIHAEYAFRAQVEEREATKSENLQELSTTAKKQTVKLEERPSSELANGKLPSANSSLDHGIHTHQNENHEGKPNGTVQNAVANPASLPSTASDPANLSTKPTILTKFRLFFTNRPARGEDFNIPQAILSMDMWILFISVTCGVGSTLTAIDNMGQIGQSLGYQPKSINTFVSLISIWNFLGRVMAGFISEYLFRRYRFPRTLVLTIVIALACVGHLLIAFPARNTLYVASIMVGLCFGAQWPLLYAIISELFGLKYYATLYNVGAIASPLGSYLFNVKVAGHLYDRQARRQHEALTGAVATGDDLKCIGSECFRLTFLIMVMVSAFGSLVSTLLVLRTRKFYRHDIYKKFLVNSDNDDENVEESRH